jgi:hypothetical protein
VKSRLFVTGLSNLIRNFEIASSSIEFRIQEFRKSNSEVGMRNAELKNIRQMDSRVEEFDGGGIGVNL